MPLWLQKLVVKLYRLFNTVPSTQQLINDARQIEKDEKDRINNNNLENSTRSSEYCCIIYWPNDWKAGEKAITVNSVRACERLATKHGAAYVRPILDRRCTKEG